MIHAVLNYSVKNPLLILGAFLIWIGAGIYSLQMLPIDAVPDVTNVQVQINTNSPGLAPLEVETQITFPIEQAMTGLPHLEELRSLSKYGLSQVTVVFDDDVDLYFARQLVFERLQLARSQIPSELGEPSMGPIATGLGEIYQYEVQSESKGPPGPGQLMALRTLQDWVIKRQLRTVRGVTEVNSFGGLERQIQVRLEPDRLRARRVSIQDVFAALSANNRNAGGGFVEHRDEQFVIRGLGLARTPEDLAQIIVRADPAAPVRIGDLGTIEDGAALRQGAVTRDGRGEIVTGIVMMLAGENSRTVAQRVDARIRELQPSMPQGVRLDPFYDRTELVDRTIATVARNLIEGAALVVVILMAVLGNLRAALIVALAIPLSMLFAVTLMVKMGLSGNLMSLGALDFGLVVDGSVVMVENTLRRLAHAHQRENIKTITVKACDEVGRPILFGVGIIAAVYLPILTLTGMEGKMFRPMAITVVLALAGSLIIAFTLVPVLASLFLKRTEEEKPTLLVRWARRYYEPALEYLMDRPRGVGLTAVALFAFSLVLIPFLGSEFLPRLDEGAVAIQAARLPSVSLTRSIDLSTQVEKALLEMPEVKTVISKTGRPDIATDPMGVELTDIVVMLKPPKDWRFATKEALVEAMSAQLERFPGISFSFSQPIELRVAELISGVRSDVALKIFGEDLTLLRGVAERAARRLAAIPGARDLRIEQISGLPYLQIKIDRNALARLGLNVSDVNEVLETALGQRPAGFILEGERRFPLVLALDQNYRDPESIGRLPIYLPDGHPIPLNELADITVDGGLAQISRENGQRRVVVEMNVRGRDLVGFVDEARQAVAPLIPSGCFATWGGQFENFERARNRLMIVVPATLLAIMALLFVSLGSGGQAALIFCNVPFAITGGVLALWLRGFPASISAGVGFIALFGVAVLNGVVLVTAINQLRETGLPIREAVFQAAGERLRPVLMTALVASLGFVPMAFSHGAGAEVQKPLATVVIGGLVTSTALTLLVLPTLYLWLEKRWEKSPVSL